jgi:hypothetical protein
MASGVFTSAVVLAIHGIAGLERVLERARGVPPEFLRPSNDLGATDGADGRTEVFPAQGVSV